MSAVTVLGAVTVTSLVVLLFLVLFTTSSPARVRLAKVCTLTFSTGLVTWLAAAVVLP